MTFKVKLGTGATLESHDANIIIPSLEADVQKSYKKAKLAEEETKNKDKELQDIKAELDKSKSEIKVLQEKIRVQEEQAYLRIKNDHLGQYKKPRKDRYFKKFPAFFE